MKDIITNKSHVIIQIVNKAEIIGDNIILDDNMRLNDASNFNIYKDVEVPDDVDSKIYCYNEEDGFYVNENFIHSLDDDIKIDELKVTGYYEKNNTETFTLSRYCSSISIMNDNNDELILSINNMDIKVKSEESFTDIFEDFNTFTVTASGPYRVLVRG